MRKIVTALVAAVSIAATVMATSSAAEARWWGPWGWGVPVVAGAVVAGAAVGSAVAARPYYYPYGYYAPGCRSVWNGYAWVRACY